MLREAVQSGDRPPVRSQAHSLKGSAVQVGAAALADSCREMEMTAEARLDLLPLLEEIEAAFLPRLEPDFPGVLRRPTR